MNKSPGDQTAWDVVAFCCWHLSSCRRHCVFLSFLALLATPGISTGQGRHDSNCTGFREVAVQWINNVLYCLTIRHYSLSWTSPLSSHGFSSCSMKCVVRAFWDILFCDISFTTSALHHDVWRCVVLHLSLCIMYFTLICAFPALMSFCSRFLNAERCTWRCLQPCSSLDGSISRSVGSPRQTLIDSGDSLTFPPAPPAGRSFTYLSGQIKTFILPVICFRTKYSKLMFFPSASAVLFGLVPISMLVNMVNIIAASISMLALSR